jgi:bacteriocin biosynthesis cyclodehydratase domain-containing protein
MPPSASALKPSSRKLRLVEQFQPVRILPGEYRLVSLFDSLSVKTTPEMGEMLDRVLPALIAGTDLSSLVDGVPPREAKAIRLMIRSLADRGLLERVDGSEQRKRDAAALLPSTEQRRFFSNFEAVTDMSQNGKSKANGADVLQQRLTDATVMIVGLGRVGSRVAQALASAGVGAIVGADPGQVTAGDLADSAYTAADVGRPREQAAGERIAAVASRVAFSVAGKGIFSRDAASWPKALSFLVLCEDVFDPAHHAAINRGCIRNDVSWIGYRSYRTKIEIGPTVVPHDTACFACYELRRVSNYASFAEEMELHERLAAAGAQLGTLNITLGADLLALEVVKSLTHFTSAATYGNVYVMDVVSLESKLHPLLKIPRCGECGAAASKPATNVWRYDLKSETVES